MMKNDMTKTNLLIHKTHKVAEKSYNRAMEDAHRAVNAPIKHKYVGSIISIASGVAITASSILFNGSAKKATFLLGSATILVNGVFYHLHKTDKK